MNTRPKVDGLSFQQRVWKMLKEENRPMSYAEIARAMGCHHSSARNACRWMIEGGHVVAHGPPCGGRRHTAGPTMPPDKRGLSPNSLANLKHHGKATGYIHSLDEGYKHKRKWHIKPKATTALEQAWGWGVGRTREVASQNEMGENLAPDVRPEFVETEPA